MAVSKKALPLTEEVLDSKFLDGVLQKNAYDTENVIMILQDITSRYNYYPNYNDYSDSSKSTTSSSHYYY